MPRNGSGSYTPPSNTWNPATPDTAILSDDWNSTLSDMSTAISQSLASDGQTTASTVIPFAQGITVSDGLLATPSIAAISDPNTGVYFPAADQIAIVVGGVAVITSTPTTVTFPVGVSFSGSPSITGNLVLTGNLTVNGNSTIGNAGADTLSVVATGTFTGNQTFNGTATFTSTVTVPDATFANAKLATVATQTIKGRVTAGTGAVEDLTATQATTVLNAVVGDSGSGGTKGLVPAPAAGDAAAGKVLKADGTWGTELKAWAAVTGTTVNMGRNVASVSNTGAGVYNVAFTTAIGNTTYSVLVTPSLGGGSPVFVDIDTRLTGSVDVNFFNAAGTPTNVSGFSFEVKST